LRAFVDTELWSFAKKRPVRHRFKSDEEFNLAMEIHRRAVEFFRRYSHPSTFTSPTIS